MSAANPHSTSARVLAIVGTALPIPTALLLDVAFDRGWVIWPAAVVTAASVAVYVLSSVDSALVWLTSIKKRWRKLRAG